VLATGNYTNTATRTASTPADPDAANDNASATPAPIGTADIAVTKAVNNAAPTVGENVVFTVTVANNGPGNALGVQITDLLPSGYTYFSHSASRGSYTVATGVWNVGTLNNGQSGTLTVTATVLASGSYTNTATRTASTPADPNAANDNASATPVPIGTADIAVTKTVNNATPTVGENVVFTVAATNNGPGNALSVQVADLLPNGYSFVIYTANGGSYSSTTGVWNIGNLNNGATRTLNITATVLATGNYMNTATKIASTPADPNAANDSASVTPVPIV